MKFKKGLLKKFLPYFKNYKWVVVFDLFCAALSTVADLVLPMIVREITNAAQTDVKTLTTVFIVKLALIYMVIKVISVAAQYYMTSTGHIMGTKIETDMRHDMFSHLEKLSFAFYDNAKVGTLMSRITTDLFDITEFAHHCPEEFFIAIVKFFASFAILANMNIRLTLIIFAIIPVMTVFLAKFNMKMRQGNRELRVQIGILNAGIEDTLSGMRVVQSFANEDMEQEKFDETNNKYLSIRKKIYKAMAGFHSVSTFFDGLMYITVVAIGSFFIKDGKITASDLIAYLLYVTTLLSTIKRIVEFADQFNKGMTGLERFSEIMDEVPDIKDKKGAKELKNVKGDIEFKNVSFRYRTSTRDVLTNINLNVKAGQNIALAGPSGGGKTTLCSLLPRFYGIENGVITVDGEDITDFTINSLRNNIGVVQQDVYIFSGSIRENIEYGKPGADFEEIKQAAVAAGADEFITEMIDGYDTYVGERGVRLSGGQKQRISIARLFLKNPPILILDEATSALDNESEKAVQLSLERLSEGRTTFTIAHRLTTIKNADNILVLTQNGIEESGTHSELMEKGGIYADMYKMYSEQ